MTESIERLEERKRRLELETAIARMERQERAMNVLSRIPSIARRIGAVVILALGAIGAILLVRGLLFQPHGVRAEANLIAGAIYLFPLVTVLLWKFFRR